MVSEAGGSAAAEVAVAVAVRDDGSRCRHAVEWTAEYLVPRARRVVLLHVIPAVACVPSPSGKCVPIDRLDREVVELYVQDVKLKAQEVFFPFKKLCGTKKVETLVLEGNNKEDVLLEYISESRINNLVLGSSSSWIRRLLKGPDLPTAILKSAPSSCNIFVVSRRKLTMKFANDRVSRDTSMFPRIEVIGHRMFARKRNFIVDGHKVSVRSSRDSDISQKTECRDASSNSQACSDKSLSVSGKNFKSEFPNNGVEKEEKSEGKTLGIQTWRNYDAFASLKDIPFLILQPTKEGELSSEVLKLRMELENILAMYNQARDDLIHAEGKMQSLSAKCFEEAKKVKDALEREEMFKIVAAEERTKYLEALKLLEGARILLAEEALDRHKAEVNASKLSNEKSELTDTKKCRIYSRKEIEFATDNYSDAKKIGEGGYGDVYKCNLDHNPVAVKVLRKGSGKREEYLREVDILSQLRHPNIVALLGVCPETGCLIYEFMENGSLEDQLFYRNEKKPLSWFVRFRILFEVACGLAFLHSIKPEPIVHRDLKPGNILLDRNYVSKIGDVGLAKVLSDVVPDGLTEYNETIISGTFYYMDPEYQQTGTIRPKSDLYALGVIALQLLTGRHPKGLIVKAEKAIKGGFFQEVLDKSISDWPLVEAERLAKLALKCCRLRCRDRPDLESEVLPELEELMNVANICLKLDQCNVCAPSHFLCPITQEIMEDPYVAADGYTYEHRAIKAWLERSAVSPVTKLKLPHTSIIPNHSLHSAIQKWRSETRSLST